ncbi:MAG TPA: VOC family protein [Acidimicrobiales bacterium]|nr:VOC family protein [Acidimicrobiales bacterium]
MALTTFLWFDNNAREAAQFYVSIFPDSSLDSSWVTPAATPSNESDSEVSISFTIFNSPFVALNGGPLFRFNESISFQIPCVDQDEIDHYWHLLTRDGGEPGRCGWLKDKFGVSWQVTSPAMGAFLNGPARAGARAATEAMIAMTKIDLDELRRAYESAATP